MFRLIRLIFLIIVAFTAGIVYEQTRAKAMCASADGQWRAGICVGSDIPND